MHYAELVSCQNAFVG